MPGRLGAGFRWLLASSWTTNLGDGIALAAGPLLVASRTDSEFLVALAALVQWAPPLVFGLWAGALTDRWDRRRIMLGANAVRSVVLVLLAVAIAGGIASIPVVLVTLFALGVAEVFTDNAASAVLPTLVKRADLAIANARLTAGFITINQLAGAPLGAFLFAAGNASPFATQAGLVLIGFALISRLRLPEREGPPPDTHLRQDIAEGFRWVVHHAAVRTLVLTIFTFNITWGAAWSVLVLYATQRLGLGEVGFGLITTVSALGGLLGTLAYGTITRFVKLGDLMRIGLVLETATHLALALTTSPPVAMVIFFLFGAHAFIWHTTSVTVRQRAVPSHLQGRVASVNLVGVFGGLVIGSALGGAIAQQLGVTGPFWFAGVGSAVFVVLIWRQLAHIAHADDLPENEDADL